MLCAAAIRSSLLGRSATIWSLLRWTCNRGCVPCCKPASSTALWARWCRGPVRHVPSWWATNPRRSTSPYRSVQKECAGPSDALRVQSLEPGWSTNAMGVGAVAGKEQPQASRELIMLGDVQRGQDAALSGQQLRHGSIHRILPSLGQLHQNTTPVFGMVLSGDQPTRSEPVHAVGHLARV